MWPLKSDTGGRRRETEVFILALPEVVAPVVYSARVVCLSGVCSVLCTRATNSLPAESLEENLIVITPENR